MKTGTFMDLVGLYYDDIKRTYISRSNGGRKFSEDIFNDAFIKCAKKFGNEIITYDDMIKYFWVAYVNTYKTDEAYNSKICLCDEYPELEDETENFSSKFYNDIMQAIEKAFSTNDMLIYSLYKYHDWSKKELLEAGYDCNNFEIKLKNIHRFVKEYTKKYIKEP